MLHPRVDRDDVIKVPCPKCGAHEFRMCVYIRRRHFSDRNYFKVGRPTKVFHDERYRFYRQAIAIRSIQTEWERRESAKLRAWLIKNHRIFERIQ